MTIERFKYSDTQLWCAVINQALIDAVSTLSNFTTSANIQEARNWFLKDNKDFREVCYMAGLEHERVREYAKRLIEEKAGRAAA